MPRRFAAVIFDMDGVLLNTERHWSRAEATLCRRLGIRYGPADEAATLGVSAIDACRHYARRAGLPAGSADQLEKELVGAMHTELEAGADVLPGGLELITRLHGRVRLGLASNSRRSVVDLAIDSSGLRPFLDAVASADDVGRPKPAPDVYLAVCDRLNVPPHDTLAIEDSDVGVAAATAAGLTVWRISSGSPTSEPGPPSLGGVGEALDPPMGSASAVESPHADRPPTAGSSRLTPAGRRSRSSSTIP